MLRQSHATAWWAWIAGGLAALPLGALAQGQGPTQVPEAYELIDSRLSGKRLEDFPKLLEPLRCKDLVGKWEYVSAARVTTRSYDDYPWSFERDRQDSGEMTLSISGSCSDKDDDLKGLTSSFMLKPDAGPPLSSDGLVWTEKGRAGFYTEQHPIYSANVEGSTAVSVVPPGIDLSSGREALRRISIQPDERFYASHQCGMLRTPKHKFLLCIAVLSRQESTQTDRSGHIKSQRCNFNSMASFEWAQGVNCLRQAILFYDGAKEKFDIKVTPIDEP
jgi:hypothetical protein